MGGLTQFMGTIFEYIFRFTGDYGWAIVLFTVIVKLILLPLTIPQINSSKKMQEIQPLLTEIQKKYNNDPQTMNQKVMELYQKNNVNPMSGCLPLLIQLPILWALFAMFRNYPAFSGVGFLWLSDLSKPDSYYMLPVLAGFTTYISTAMITPKNAQSNQMMMNIMMPILIAWMTITLPSGLAVYWVVSNIFQIIQQYFFYKRPSGVKGETNS
ncbi:MAG: YidC/Oxa1 family membrane protein insertase [Thermoanaerobacteraceae bacterium]|nr:YidC/Oxa1 family membrane protein insertase [Thermoanaerobacteraceae bacterium]